MVHHFLAASRSLSGGNRQGSEQGKGSSGDPPLAPWHKMEHVVPVYHGIGNPWMMEVEDVVAPVLYPRRVRVPLFCQVDQSVLWWFLRSSNIETEAKKIPASPKSWHSTTV